MSTTFMAIARGSKNDIDPYSACLANEAATGKYVVLEVSGNHVSSRRLFRSSERSVVEKIASEASRGGTTVLYDMRKKSDILPLTIPRHADPLDFQGLVRARSEDEILRVQALSRKTFDLLHQDRVSNARSFRGVSEQSECDGTLEKRQMDGFVQYRAGMRDEKGLVSDLTRVVPQTPEWEQRMGRIYKGLQAVGEAAVVGASHWTLKSVMESHLDASKDQMLDMTPIRFTGFRGNEKLSGHMDDTLRGDDVVTLGASFCPTGAHTRNAAQVFTRVLHVQPNRDGAAYRSSQPTSAHDDEAAQATPRAYDHARPVVLPEGPTWAAPLSTENYAFEPEDLLFVQQEQVDAPPDLDLLRGELEMLNQHYRGAETDAYFEQRVMDLEDQIKRGC